jgi:hypothetical protein
MMTHYESDVQRHKWFFLVDNILVIQKLETCINTTITPKCHLTPDADILAVTTQFVLKDIPLNFIHVRSHQDNGKKGNELSYDAQLNCMANKLAQHHNSEMQTPHMKQFRACAQLEIHGMIVILDSQTWLRDTAGKTPIIQYYTNKVKWTKATFNAIHWSAQQAVLSCYDINEQWWRMLKFVHGWLPTNDCLFCDKQAQRCPLCYYLVKKQHTPIQLQTQ